MQPQFESMRLAAQSYEQQLRADAALVRSATNVKPGNRLSLLPRWRLIDIASVVRGWLHLERTTATRRHAEA
jgi:hypothetical protein